MVRLSRSKLNRKTLELTDFINQIDLTDISRTFHLNTKEYSYLSACYRTFPQIDHVFSLRVSLNRYKKIAIIPCILIRPLQFKPGFKKNRNNNNSTNAWKLNNCVLNKKCQKVEREKLKTS